MWVFRSRGCTTCLWRLGPCLARWAQSSNSWPASCSNWTGTQVSSDSASLTHTHRHTRDKHTHTHTNKHAHTHTHTQGALPHIVLNLTHCFTSHSALPHTVLYFTHCFTSHSVILHTAPLVFCCPSLLRKPRLRSDNDTEMAVLMESYIHIDIHLLNNTVCCT